MSDVSHVFVRDRFGRSVLMCSGEPSIHRTNDYAPRLYAASWDPALTIECPMCSLMRTVLIANDPQLKTTPKTEWLAWAAREILGVEALTAEELSHRHWVKLKREQEFNQHADRET
ncbi:MAG: hypothetical protein WAV09_03175 [Minisyncoccia bacterium]